MNKIQSSLIDLHVIFYSLLLQFLPIYLSLHNHVNPFVIGEKKNISRAILSYKMVKMFYINKI